MTKHPEIVACEPLDLTRLTLFEQTPTTASDQAMSARDQDARQTNLGPLLTYISTLGVRIFR